MLLFYQGAISVYSTKTFTETGFISYPMHQGGYWPDTMHFDAKTDLLWLLTSPEAGVMVFCSAPATFNSSSSATNSVANLTCHEPLLDKYVYVPDSSAFDTSTGVIWVGLDKAMPQNGHDLTQRRRAALGTAATCVATSRARCSGSVRPPS